MSKREIRILNKLSMKIIGIPYEMLNREDQDFICCEAYERDLF